MSNAYKALIVSAIVAVILVIGIVVIAPYVSDVVLAPDTGASHYYWKLTERSTLNMTIVWSLFAIHLFGNYYLIRKRMADKSRGFNKYNTYILLFNLVMIIIHYIQSIIGYDGLAQDVSVFSSQYSVIFVLVTIILIELPRRGIAFGIKFKTDPTIQKFLYAVHGFVFTFSIVYTFWFHPVVNTIGHLFGFFYMFLLFTQIGMVKTEVHTNPKWIVWLEVLVAFHGASVAYFVQDSSLWAMFLFGFGFIFVITQIYALGLSKVNIIAIQFLYSIMVLYYYFNTDITNIHQILWIPMIEYLNVGLLLAIAYGIRKLILIRNSK